MIDFYNEIDRLEYIGEWVHTVNGRIRANPPPYKIKTAEFNFGGPSEQYPILAVTRPRKKSGLKREVFLISTDYFEKYPTGPLLSDTADIFLRRALYPMLHKGVKDLMLQ